MISRTRLVLAAALLAALAACAQPTAPKRGDTTGDFSGWTGGHG